MLQSRIVESDQNWMFVDRVWGGGGGGGGGGGYIVRTSNLFFKCHKRFTPSLIFGSNLKIYP